MSLWWCLVPLLSLAPANELPESLLLNGSYVGTHGWSIYGGQLADRAGGGRCLRLNGRGSASQDIDVEQPGTYSVAVDLRVTDVRAVGGPGYAYAAVYQLDANGELVAFRDFVQLTGTQEWKRYTFTFQSHPLARTVSIRCGLFQAEGTAEYADWTLVAGAQPKRADEVRSTGSSRSGGTRAAILNEPGMPVRGAASQPAVIRTILEQAGFTVEYLSAAQMADTSLLRPDRFGVVVLPTGASFPAAARRAWLRYLHRGGSFVSLGGYAFDHLVAKTDAGWVTEKERLAKALQEATSPERSLLADGGFERTETAPMGGESLDARWHRNHESAVIVSEGAAEGQRCAQVSAAPGAAVDERKFMLDLPAKPWRYRVSARVRTKEVTGPGFAYVALYQYDANGKLIKHRDFMVRTGTTDWTDGGYEFVPEQGVTRLHIKFGLYRATGTAWFDDLRLCNVTGVAYEPINTAMGGPGDGLQLQPTQLGAFDPSAPLKRAVRAETAAGQPLAQTPVAVGGDLQGWMATGVQGQNNARWVPILETRDRYGRPRGAAAAFLLHYGGYFAGSRWAYFGIDNRDLFSDAASPAARLLGEVARNVARAPFLHNLACEQAFHRPGETVKVSCAVAVAEALPAGSAVRFAAGPADAPARVTGTTKLVGSDAQAAQWQFQVPNDAVGSWQVQATLLAGNREVDRLTSGVELPVGAAVEQTPELRFERNSFTLGGRPMFIFGTDDYGVSYDSPYRGAATWRHEMQAMRDIGLDLYENLQYTHPNHAMADQDWRRFDAVAQLTQRFGLIFMPGILIGHNVVCDDAELQRQSALCRAYAERLGRTPALLWYINGDYQLTPHEAPAVTKALWERWLHQRYPTAELLRAAWPGAENAPWPVPDTGRWDDRAQIDRAQFCGDLMRRWNAAHVAAIRQGDPQHPITSEYYQMPFYGIDLRLTIEGQNVSNIGYFDLPQKDLDLLPLRLAWNDLRQRGKGIALGEYGVKTHPAWATSNGATGYHIQRTEEEQQQLHLGVAAYTLGMGGAKVQNWCLKDAEQSVFPWGFLYPQQLLAKDAALTHRNASLLWRHLAPADEPAPLAVCLPGRMRVGAREHLGLNAGYRAFDALLGLHADFRVIDDHEAGDLGPGLRAVVLPAAYALDDAAFQRLTAWVRAGGHLLVSGDPSYDELRRPAATDRLAALCGVRRVAALGPPAERGPQAVSVDLGAPVGTTTLRPCVRVAAAGAEVLAGSDDGPVLTRYKLGQGQVTYLTDPLELSPESESGEPTRAVYARFLTAAGIATRQVTPNHPWLHAMERPTRSGRVHVLFGRQELAAATVQTKAGALTLGLRTRWPALAHLGADRAVRLVVASGEASLDGQPLASLRGLQGLVALDGQDLRRSEELLVTPFDAGEVRLPARPGRYQMVVGDLVGGRFRAFETATVDGSALRVALDEDRHWGLVLVCREGRGPAAIAKLEQMANRPWTVAGW